MARRNQYLEGLEFRAALFPAILAVMELNTWQERAEELNANGLTTQRGKPFTADNLQRLYSSYYAFGPYSHAVEIERLERLRSVVESQQEELV